MTISKAKSQLAERRYIASGLVLKAKLKEHEAACWLGLQGNIEQARAAVQSATEAKLEATEEQIRSIKSQHGHAA